MYRFWIAAGALAGLLAVALSAWAAHGAAAQLAEGQLQMLDRAITMQGWHALALFGTGLYARRRGGLAHLAGAAFLLGLLAFCGAVYALAIFGLSLGRVAPVGGSLLMVGWLLVFLAAFKRE